mmetsp:Transcript_14253/g.39279  ORF Transcript_14253/g.39279 Transcript_14253/m.39279 type:complete len:273 (+) Transcript_14253:1190-2008(+)
MMMAVQFHFPRIGVREHLLPPALSQSLQTWVEQIRCQNAVHHELAETSQLHAGGADAGAEIFVPIIHQQIPCQVDRLLLRHAAMTVQLGHIRIFLGNLVIGDPGVIRVVNQRGKDDGELCERIRIDAVRSMVQIHSVRHVQLAFVDDDAVQELVSGHGHVAGVVEVVIMVGVVVQFCDSGDVVSDLFHDLGTQVDVLRIGLLHKHAAVEARHFQRCDVFIAYCGIHRLFQQRWHLADRERTLAGGGDDASGQNELQTLGKQIRLPQNGTILS